MFEFFKKLVFFTGVLEIFRNFQEFSGILEIYRFFHNESIFATKKSKQKRKRLEREKIQ
jgi:hypothetical protein